jgi:hypothetical protein
LPYSYGLLKFLDASRKCYISPFTLRPRVTFLDFFFSLFDRWEGLLNVIELHFSENGPAFYCAHFNPESFIQAMLFPSHFVGVLFTQSLSDIGRDFIEAVKEAAPMKPLPLS